MQEQEKSEQPQLEEVQRYFDGSMSPKEEADFERRAGRSEDFARRARSICDALGEFEGLKARPGPDAPDWELLARQERSLFWRDRLRQAGSYLAAHGRHLTDMAEMGAAAALEVTLNVTHSATEQVAQLLAWPVQACLRPNARMEFGYATTGIDRQKGIRARGGRTKESAAQLSRGLIASSIFKAMVQIDKNRRTLTVDFLGKPAPSVLILVPQDPNHSPMIEKVLETPAGSQAVFRNLPDGEYLLGVPLPAAEEEL